MSKNNSNELVFTFDEIREKIEKEKRILIILFEGGVYDLTQFAANHPGGEEILKEFNGKNATKIFLEMGHLNGVNIIPTLAKLRLGKIIEQQQKQEQLEQQKQQAINYPKL